MSDRETLFQLFIEETREHLEKIIECLLHLEKKFDATDSIHALFRSVHTIKGSTSAMNFTRTVTLIHKMEDVIQLARDGKLTLSEKSVKLLFLCYDYLENFLEKVSSGESDEALTQSHIYEELCLIVAANTMPVETKEILTENGIFAKPEKISDMIAGLSTTKRPYFIHVQMCDDMVYPEISAWLILQEFTNQADLYFSCPALVTNEEFKVNGLPLNGVHLDFIATSELPVHEIEKNLWKNLQDISHLYVCEMQVENNMLKHPYLSYSSSLSRYFLNEKAFYENEMKTSAVQNTDFRHSSDSKFNSSPEFVNEISENIARADSLYLALKFSPNSKKEIKSLYRIFHTIKGLAGFVDNPTIVEVSKETAIMLDMACKSKIVLDDILLNLVLLSIDWIKQINGNESGDTMLNENGVRSHVSLLQAQIHAKQVPSSATTQTILPVPTVQNIPDEIVYTETYPQVEKIPEPASGETHPVEAATKSGANTDTKMDMKGMSFIRIPEYKVDNLVDMMGELIILQSLVKESITQIEPSHVENSETTQDILLANMDRMERIIKDIQSTSMSLRMVSIKQTLQKILRIGRDTAKELEKAVEFEIEGEDTEVDRAVVDKIQDPLMHLVRNSVSHGIEDTQTRHEKNKNPMGSVQIKAYNKKGNVYIEISDDGRGLDLDRIYSKAVERNIAVKGRNYTENEIISFIFLPGFSTQEVVNNISGRGVGLNVVDSEIKHIGGKIEVRNNPGKGSTFILKIPVNLATINGTIVSIGGHKYIVPTLNVKQIFKPTPEQWIKLRGKIVSVKNREDIIPLIPVDKTLGLPNAQYQETESVVIILEYDGAFRALPVQSVVGKQEIVIKPIGVEFQHLKFLSGATILGDGKVSLILDVESLFIE